MLDVSGDCGQPEVPPHTAGRIVNGEEATPHSFPWMVFIYINIYSTQYNQSWACNDIFASWQAATQQRDKASWCASRRGIKMHTTESESKASQPSVLSQQSQPSYILLYIPLTPHNWLSPYHLSPPHSTLHIPHKPSSALISPHQPLSTLINPHQPPLTLISPHQQS